MDVGPPRLHLLVRVVPRLDLNVALFKTGQVSEVHALKNRVLKFRVLWQSLGGLALLLYGASWPVPSGGLGGMASGQEIIPAPRVTFLVDELTLATEADSSDPRIGSLRPESAGTRWLQWLPDLRSAVFRPRYQLPGEFESQQAIVVSCHEFVDDMPDVFVQIVNHVHGRLKLVALVNDVKEYPRPGAS